MSLFQRLQRMLGARLTGKDALDLLSDSIAELGDQVMIYDGIHLAAVRRHLQSAEDSCKSALKALTRDDEVVATRRARTGLVHMHIARLLMTGKEQQTRLEVQSGIDTIEGALNYLIHQIAKVKLLVEYGDLQVNPAVQDSLMNVMKIFDATVADLRKRRTGDAKREADAAMVALHWTVCLLEASNPLHGIAELKMPKEGATTAEIKACELAASICDYKNKLTEMQVAAMPEVMMHLEAAEEKFAACIENLIEGDKASTVLEARAGQLDLQTAMRTANEALNASERRQNSQTRMVVSQFKQDSYRVLRLCEQLNIDYRSLERRMKACEDYFIKAHRLLEQNELNEAERLARAAHLDLDFSWQIANAAQRAEYRQEL